MRPSACRPVIKINQGGRDDDRRTPVPLEEVLPLRQLYRQEMNCQIVHDSLPGRGFGDVFLIRADGRVAGYGFVMGYYGEPKDMIQEYYVLPAYRGSALAMFRRLMESSQARRVEVQTNDILLTLMLYDLMLRDHERPDHLPRRPDDEPRDPRRELPSRHRGGSGSHLQAPCGGLANGFSRMRRHRSHRWHCAYYNPPYGDLYMEVDRSRRRRGFGSYLIQELKRACYEMGRIPAARCNAVNEASRETLQKAGLLPCARMLTGVLSDG